MREFIDLTGERFGRLEVLQYHHSKKYKSCTAAYWLCKCDCGNEKVVSGCSLKSGHTRSCGCFNRQRASETHFCDLVGKKFGKLTAVKVSGKKWNGYCWECICDCGSVKIVPEVSLASGKTKSCGCLRIKNMK